jgi:hypothetical protein
LRRAIGDDQLIGVSGGDQGLQSNANVVYAIDCTDQPRFPLLCNRLHKLPGSVLVQLMVQAAWRPVGVPMDKGEGGTETHQERLQQGGRMCAGMSVRELCNQLHS